jgi:hypothetical protein
MKTNLGTIYCPSCGGKMAFIEKEITENAIEERRAEKLTKAHTQLIQWIGFAVFLLVLSNMFRDLSNRMPSMDIMPFFYGPPVVGAGEDSHLIIIGRGESYLELGKIALPIQKVNSIAAGEPTPDEKASDVEVVTNTEDVQTTTITTKDGRSIQGTILGKTNTHITVAAGGKIEVLAADNVK